MLTAFESDVFTALSHYTGSAGAAADDRSNRCAFTATGDGADDRADTGSRADFRCVVLGRVAPSHAAFGIDLTILETTNWRDLDKLGVQSGRAIVRGTNLVERQLQFGDALYFPGTSHLCNSSFDDVTGVLRRLEDSRLKSITTLARLSRERR